MRHIICVHVGSKYTDDYVIRLYNSCKRHSVLPFRFIVLHDSKLYPIEDEQFVPIPVNHYSFLNEKFFWWYKMQAFRPDVVADENLLIDIDTVIVGSIDKFWNYSPDKFCIIQDFNRHWQPNYGKSNSSVVKFTKAIAEDVYPRWIEQPVQWIRKYRGDQDWFDGEMKNMEWWPKHWIQSWKWEVYKGGKRFSHRDEYNQDHTEVQTGCSVLVFHGKPDPHEIDHKIVRDNWI